MTHSYAGLPASGAGNPSQPVCRHQALARAKKDRGEWRTLHSPRLWRYRGVVTCWLYNAPSINWRTTFRTESPLPLSMAGQTGYGNLGRLVHGAVATRHGPDSAACTPPGSLPHPVSTQHACCSTFTLRSCWIVPSILSPSAHALPMATERRPFHHRMPAILTGRRRTLGSQAPIFVWPRGPGTYEILLPPRGSDNSDGVPPSPQKQNACQKMRDTNSAVPAR